MLKILVLTDIHITPEGETIIGLDPLARFRRVLDQAIADHPDAAHLVITGDLTHFGTIPEYERLRAAMPPLPCDITWMLGNHDNRDAFRTVFPEASVDDNGFVQRTLDLGPLRLVMLDTLHAEAPPKHAGRLCAERLAFLREAASTFAPTVVFMHHPPFATGFTGMDGIGLRNEAEVRNALSDLPNLSLVVAGHIHRTICTNLGTAPCVTFKSTCHQMPFLLGESGSSHSVDEPGAYGLLLVDELGGVVVHTEDVLHDGAREISADAASS